MSISNQDLLSRVTDSESKLVNLSEDLQHLNKRLEDTQHQWNDLIALHVETLERTPLEDSVIYQETFDEKRQAALLPINIQASLKSLDDVFSDVNRNVYHQMQCANGLSSGSLADSLVEYRRLLTQIVNENPNLKFVTAYELSQAAKDGEIRYCQIRHDVDADIVACLPMAEIEAALGIKSTFFLLHTATYFGEWQIDKVKNSALFLRNEALADYYLKLQELGHEVAIHTDPLYLYQNLYVDGAEELLASIDWLRSKGLKINGTAPHNNPGEYGASNSAVFKENSENLRGVIKNGKWCPLGVLEESKLHLFYEADDMYSKESSNQISFISPVSPNKWWVCNQNKNIKYLPWDIFIAKKNSQKLFETDVKWQSKNAFRKVFQNRTLNVFILSIHPEHFGYRLDENSPPYYT